MSFITSIGVGIPAYTLTQHEVKEMVPQLFPAFRTKMRRLLPIFDHSQIDERQVVVHKEWFLEEHSFSERNQLYIDETIRLYVQAIQECMHNLKVFTHEFPLEQIDMLLFVSSSGISTPSIDAHIMNELPFRSDVVRLPLWGLGCAGG